MRFIVKEQRYEKQIGSGLFRYELDSVPTGAVEHWRLTQATEGYEVLRVDLDAREAASGYSYLYNLVRRADGTLERLAYRFWGDGLQVEGTLLFSETNITGTRSVNGRTYEEDLDIEPGTPFWFPSVVGLGLLMKVKRGLGVTAVTLNNAVDDEDTLALQQVMVDVVEQETVEVEVVGKMITAVPTMIHWNDQRRFVTRNLNFWPVVLERPDFVGGKILSAKETQYIWY